MLPDPRAQILVVDDEANLRRVLCAQLQREGYDVHAASDGQEALQILSNHHVDVVVTDLRMPGVDGMTLLREAQKIDVDLPVIMITAHGSVDNAVEALKSGAFDYLTKPFDQTDVQVVVRKAIQTRRFSEREAHRSSVVSVWEGSAVVGTSSAATRLMHDLEQAAQRESHVLIIGERGTGKELLARALHRVSPRQKAPFIKAHCEATSPEFIAAELFGIDSTSDQGSAPRPGKVELASGGCLLLEEVSQTDASLQRRLTSLMQHGRFEREAGVHHYEAHVRVLASLRGLPNEPTLLPDLRECFQTTIYVPPLRERLEDIPALCRHFVARYSQRLSKAIDGVDDAVFDVLSRYTWPGNLRELENVMEHAVLFCDESRIGVSSLPALDAEQPALLRPAPGAGVDDVHDASNDLNAGLKERVKEATSKLERDLIHRALHQTAGNVTHAARLLKISRKGLQLKMKELGLREREQGG